MSVSLFLPILTSIWVSSLLIIVVIAPTDRTYILLSIGVGCTRLTDDRIGRGWVSGLSWDRSVTVVSGLKRSTAYP